MSSAPHPGASLAQSVARLVLGGFLLAAGLAHLTVLRAEFSAQVPSWLPLGADAVVVGSGVVEAVLGAALLALPGRRRQFGVLAAVLFVAVFPGNLAQYVEGTDAFGLDTDRARLIRLFFQPLLVAWALWVSGVLTRRRSGSAPDHGSA